MWTPYVGEIPLQRRCVRGVGGFHNSKVSDSVCTSRRGNVPFPISSLAIYLHTRPDWGHHQTPAGGRGARLAAVMEVDLIRHRCRRVAQELVNYNVEPVIGWVIRVEYSFIFCSKSHY
ncbi:hypothetical protein CEXT_53721 [Caerostris extrusa]|uniref:Uncharacterized protein n=1 Tax=Caerostris extrusa TaxID=172846 RepID=A0AAV4V9D2_CAEEX|nr:hypothetical protein CEXT_53721 [Caerostris extrusa]